MRNKYVVQHLSLYEDFREEYNTMDEALENLEYVDLWVLWEKRNTGDIIVGSNLSGKSCE
jgi:hypothetical protein